jgi:uncharacterized membrane protein YidH (DUF202 family)
VKTADLPFSPQSAFEVVMKIVLIVVGVLLILVGTVWFFQGINVLPGSFMTGQTQWAIYGSISVVIGAVLLLVAFRRKG